MGVQGLPQPASTLTAPFWRRHHLHETVLQRVVKEVRQAGIEAGHTPHLRRSFATHARRRLRHPDGQNCSHRMRPQIYTILNRGPAGGGARPTGCEA
jgi:hypothetical protein